MSDETTAPPPPPSKDELAAIEAAKVEDEAKKSDLQKAQSAKREADVAAREEAKTAAAKARKTKKGRGRFKALGPVPIHHPYQKVTVPVNGDVDLEVDNWVEVQAKAGVIGCTDGSMNSEGGR